MSTKNDGGPAFPAAGDGIHQVGMSPRDWRDWFAAFALAGEMAGDDGAGDYRTSLEREEAKECLASGDLAAVSRIYWRAVARTVYMVADAMLAEREREG